QDAFHMGNFKAPAVEIVQQALAAGIDLEPNCLASGGPKGFEGGGIGVRNVPGPGKADVDAPCGKVPDNREGVGGRRAAGGEMEKLGAKKRPKTEDFAPDLLYRFEAKSLPIDRSARARVAAARAATAVFDI